MTKNQYAHQRGKINDSAVKALVTDPLFRTRVERNKKGKGSYQRHEKHKGANRGESPTDYFKWAFSLVCYFTS